ncbi:unnamed protein product [Tetraodon nigroviridis]|uniref:(spotted green pufferfish) hypothetical protein n=1 Tax=Tetraodon nigroviridis TaxID=99883 RepID=Q4RYI6_TETNG|nr:unnamed protein product [Tetraodon nigroviridis]
MTHPHWDKPRVGHTACLGRDHDVLVFGGSSNMCASTTVLRSPSQHHSGDMFCFQTQPYSLHRTLFRQVEQGDSAWMDSAERTAPASRLERSGHSAFIDDNTLFVFGGYQGATDHRGRETPGSMRLLRRQRSRHVLRLRRLQRKRIHQQDVQRGPDAAQLLLEENPGRQGNRAVAAEQPLLLGAQGQVGGPGGLVSSPWIQTFVILSFPPLFPHRLIYFGGYGCKTVGEMQNTPAANFVIEELSWVSGGTLEEPLSPAGVNVALVSQAVIENTLFRCWGWNNEVNVFDTHAAAWSSPAVRVGTSQAGAASVAAHAQPVLCSPGIPAHAQRLPRQRPAGEQGLHHRRRGESTRPGEEFALRSNIAGE